MEGCSGQNRPSVSHFERARDGGVEQRGLWTVVAKKTPPPCVSSERGGANGGVLITSKVCPSFVLL